MKAGKAWRIGMSAAAAIAAAWLTAEYVIAQRGIFHWWFLGAAEVMAVTVAVLTVEVLRRDRSGIRALLTAAPLLMIAAEQVNFPEVTKTYGAQQILFGGGLILLLWSMDWLIVALLAGHRNWRAGVRVLLAAAALTLPGAVLCRNLIDGSMVGVESIQALYQTDPAEAFDFFVHMTSGVWLLPLALVALPGVWWWCRRAPEPELRWRHWHFAAIAGVVGIALTATTLFCGDCRSLSQELCRRSLEYFDEIDYYQSSRDDRRALAQTHITTPGDDGIFVLILGESHNRNYFEVYGYEKKTTPELCRWRQDPRLIFFTQAFSCHAQTIPSLSYLLTNRDQYANNSGSARDGVITLLDAAAAKGYRTNWISNQFPWGEFDTPVAGIAAEADQQVWLNSPDDFLLKRTRHDGELLQQLPVALDGDRKLVIFHMMGSHRHYPNRYPEGFAADTDLTEYEKTVLYSDQVLGEMLARLSADPRVKAVLFVSDHSHVPVHNLGHSADHFIQEMAEIPMFLYLSESFRQEHPALTARLTAHRNRVFTNDLIFGLMLSLMNLQNDFTPARYQLTSDAYALEFGEAASLWGRQKLLPSVGMLRDTPALAAEKTPAR